jgi:hypothetical protein
MPLQEQSHIVIGHLTSRTPAWGLTWWGEERRYRPAAFPVRRPEAGESVVELRCPTCDAELLLRVRSLALSRLIRKRFLVAAAVGAVVAVVTVAIGLGSEYAGAPIPLATAFGKVLLIASLLSFAAVAVGLVGWRREEGLRLYTVTAQGDETHRVLFGAEPHDASAP